jgi:hypothetical protein
MKNILKIIKEEVATYFNEDVGDEYLKRKYHMKGEFDDFENKYISHQQNDDKVIYREGDWKLIKNPESLKDMGRSARGIIMSNGDLYLESFSGKKIHNDLLKILYNKGILSYLPKKNWGRKSPNETGFLTVQRYKTSPYIAIGESNRRIYDEEEYQEHIDEYESFLNKAKQKNPNIRFENKLVGTKSPLKTKGGNMMNESYL